MTAGLRDKNFDSANIDGVVGTPSLRTLGTGAQQAAAGSHVADTANPHAVTKVQVGLGNVDNVQQIPLTEKGAANGVATLDGSSKINTAQLPSIALTDTFVVANEAAMLALTAQTGDVAVRTDLPDTFILKGTNASVLADWEILLHPASPVQSVAGKTGVVTLDHTTDLSGVGTNSHAQIDTHIAAVAPHSGHVTVVSESFAATNARFFGELGLPASQGWIDTATGSATIDLVDESVFGITKQVVRHNDDFTNGATTSQLALTAQNWTDINTFGASYSGTSRLDTIDGANGFFSGLQANAADNPLVTGDRRYGINFKNSGGNLQVSDADAGGSTVIFDGTGGNPQIDFDEYVSWECVVPAGLGAAEFYVNGVLSTFAPLFLTNTGGLGTSVRIGSGSTSGVDRVTYHSDFGVTIYEEAPTKTLAAATMAADVAEVFIPEGKRDYTIILPDGNPRPFGAKLDVVANNLLGQVIFVTQNQAVPEALFNGLRELTLDIAFKEVISGLNTVNNANVYLGFEISESPGNVTGTATSTDTAIVRFDGTTGEKIDQAPANTPTIDDTGKMAISNVLVGTGTIGATPVSGAGTRIMWIPAKAAFRVGVVTGTEWDDANIGVRSFASGKDCIASGADSTAMGDGCNASGSNTWAMGRSCVASSAEAVAMGTSCTASAEGAVAMGSNCNATGTHSFAVGRNTTAVEKSMASGARASARLIGTHTHASGRIVADGDAQTTVAPVMRQTTDATLTELTLEGAIPGPNSRLVIPDDTTWTFSILIVGRNTTSTENAGYKFEGVIKRDTGAASTALVGTVIKTVIAEDVAAWDAIVDADATNGSLRVRAQGEAAKTINWVARCELSEVTG